MQAYACVLWFVFLQKLKQQQQQHSQPKAGKQQHVVEVEQQTAHVSGIMSDATFDDLQLSGPTAQGVTDMGFTHMTEVQVRHACLSRLPDKLLASNLTFLAGPRDTCQQQLLQTTPCQRFGDSNHP
jgi:hypothetical protein